MSDNLDINNELTLTTPQDQLEQKILEETDIDELKNIVDLFNINIKKKDIIRTSKLSELQDKVFDQMEERLEKHAGEFSNKDLLDYFKVMQESINKADTSLDNVNKPAIQYNQFNINVEEDNLDRTSKQRIIDAIAAIMKDEENENSDIITEDYVEIVDEPEEVLVSDNTENTEEVVEE